MREHSWQERRDHVVHLLARLSLVAVLALLGALFVGGAATSESAGSSAQSLLDQARPVGLVLAAVVIGGGLVVLVVAALKPPAPVGRRDVGDLVDH